VHCGYNSAMRYSPYTVLALAVISAAGCAQPAAEQPFKAAATTLELMEGPIAHAAEVYWGSVSTIVDKDGVTEHYPTTDEEWEAVWAAAITISESGNLMMMAPRAKEEADWMKFSAESSRLIDRKVLRRLATRSRLVEDERDVGQEALVGPLDDPVVLALDDERQVGLHHVEVVQGELALVRSVSAPRRFTNAARRPHSAWHVSLEGGGFPLLAQLAPEGERQRTQRERHQTMRPVFCQT